MDSRVSRVAQDGDCSQPERWAQLNRRGERPVRPAHAFFRAMFQAVQHEAPRVHHVHHGLLGHALLAQTKLTHYAITGVRSSDGCSILKS